MKSGVAAGAIAGLISGIVGFVFGALGYFAKLYEIGTVPVTNIAITQIVLTIIFGAILGAIYSKLYDSIPGKGAMKGLYSGLIIWLIGGVMTSTYIAFHTTEISTAIRLIFVGFFMWISYGPVLGVLYKK